MIFIQSLGFVGSTVKGSTICCGCTILTSPKHSTEPFINLSIMVSVIKSTKLMQLLELLNTLGRGNS